MYLHDPEYHLTFAEAMAPGGPVRALTELRDQGVLGHLGVAGGPVGLMREFIATGEFDVVLNHNRFTLIDRSAEPLMDDACQRGVAFVNGAPYGGGILAKGPDVQPKYAYRPASPDVSGRGPRDAARLCRPRRVAGRCGAAVLPARPAGHRHGGRAYPSRRGSTRSRR